MSREIREVVYVCKLVFWTLCSIDMVGYLFHLGPILVALRERPFKS